MAEFINRTPELTWLNSGWDGRPQLRILFGRRRTGKSALLDEFVKDKKHITYQAVEGTATDHLADLTTAILATHDDPVLRAGGLANWNTAFAYLLSLAKAGPLAVIFDEYQYAAQATPELASILQRWWSRDVGEAPLYLILCGSYIRFFQQNVLAGPAYGRNTGSWQLQPLGFPEASLFFPNWNVVDQIYAYAVTGGIPYYLLQFDPAKSLAWNIINRVLTRGTVLYNEAELLTREELREPRNYMSLLRAMAAGVTRDSELQNILGATGSVNSYLRNLAGLGLAALRTPVQGSKRGSWVVEDPYLRFWFRFVQPNLSLLDHNADPERFFHDTIEPEFDHFVSMPAFEDICRDWIGRQVGAGRAPKANVIGFWSGMVVAPTPENPRYQIRGELEIVGMDGNELSIVGEAKWQNAPVGEAELNHVLKVLPSVPGYVAGNVEIYLFGKTFDQHIVERAKREGIRLVAPPDLLS